jgi:hypothetical protein
MAMEVRSMIVALASAALMVACGGGSDGQKQPDQQLGGGSSAINQSADECQDEDGDGFGEGCKNGADCDDNDDTKFESCDVCLDTEEGCACASGTAAIKCTLSAEESGDGNLCHTGLRYCQDGLWTGCQGTANFQ